MRQPCKYTKDPLPMCRLSWRILFPIVGVMFDR
jgi:hypothetical protein